MQRFNSFALIHKALRAMLYDAALTLQQTCFDNSDEADTALEKVEAVLFLFERHAHHEDHHVLPAIEMYEPQLVADFETEHVKDLELGERLKTLLNIFRDATAPEDLVYCGSAICKSFVSFMVFNLEHMAKEELLINQALWKHFTDEQLLMLNEKLVATIPPSEKAISSRWMLRGLNNAEIVDMLKNVRETAPDFVYGSILQMAATELTEERLEKIQERLFEPAMA